MSLRTLLFGQPLASEEEHKEQIGPLAGIPLLGLDALASAAYGPEAALTMLIPLGALGLHYIVPISAALIALLLIVYTSYRQTIDAYPTGGGSYTVAKENLGTRAGLLAAAALMLDYMLNVAVAISAGVGALVSAAPPLLPYTLPLCLAILAVLVVANLRGPRSSGLAFAAPTYTFLACLFTVIAIGVVKTVTHGGAPDPVIAPPPPHAEAGAVSVWLLLRAFANGCTAMTGVEAVSNGVPVFREPSTVHARRTLGLIIASLVVLLAGVAVLSRAYDITATAPGKHGYQSLLSMMVAAVAGRGVFYYLTIGAVVVVLCLSANTSFAGFPRLCRILAADRFLPEPFEHRGRRLAFSYGIVVLAVLAGILLVVFGGVTEGLIPLFAVGALLAFTMSQAGMVVHWRRTGGRHARRALIINAVGATATAATLGVVLVSKFTEGAWISTLLVGLVITTFCKVRGHYRTLDNVTRTRAPLTLDAAKPIVVLPLRRWDRVTRAGLRFAYNLSDEVYALQVRTGDRAADDLSAVWRDLVEEPVKKAGKHPPELVVFRSRYRHLYKPILGFTSHLAHAHPDRPIAVIVPELVEPHWYHRLLHNNTAALLKWLLRLHAGEGIAIISAPWYLSEHEQGA
ncbi:MAG: APC family permease [Minicystis sp.]